MNSCVLVVLDKGVYTYTISGCQRNAIGVESLRLIAVFTGMESGLGGVIVATVLRNKGIR